MSDIFFNKISSISNTSKSELETAKQMLFSNSVSNNLNSLGQDKVIFSNNVTKTSNKNTSTNLKSPREQIMDLGRKYNVPFDGNINTYQSKVIKVALVSKARQMGIPENVALGIAGNESEWRMWSDVDKGIVVQGKNIRNGVLKSTDWGVMQINDKAHPKAFPRAKYDLEYNIDYALNLLAKKRINIKGSLGLGFGDWDRTIASYNLGHNPVTKSSYQKANKYVSKVKQKSIIVQEELPN
ncbi:MAG: hypothetical protein KatS3mg068_2170 [Candidatus Sericytochromatia bacterium]|nr:MAG: hypothetical protein KatS3mg068_2170 [Candidatus Sericytochromatia bacterium]